MSSTNARSPGAVEFALLAGVSLTWGTSFMFTKIAVAEVAPVTVIALRTSIAATAMIALLVIRGRNPRLTIRDAGDFALVGLMANAAPLCLIAISVSLVDSSVTATTMALTPLVTAILAACRCQVPNTRVIVGIAVGLAGIAVLYGPDAFASFGDSARGAAAAIAATIIFSASLFAMARVARHDPMTVTMASLVAAALWTLPLAFLADGPPAAWPGTGTVGALIVLALFNTAASSLLMFALVPRAGPTFTSYNNYIVPTVAVACGVLFLGEPFTLRGAAGVGLVLAGVAVSTVRRKATVHPPAITG